MQGWARVLTISAWILGGLGVLVLLGDGCRPVFLTRTLQGARVVHQTGPYTVEVYHENGYDPPTTSETVICEARVEGLDLDIQCADGRSCCRLREGHRYDLEVGQAILNRLGCRLAAYGRCRYELLASTEVPVDAPADPPR